MLKKLAPGCSNGKVLKSLDTAGFIMTEVAYSARRSLAKHSHENAHFCLVLPGTYTESHNRQELECAPFTLTFRPPGEVHEDKFHNQEVRVFTIEIPPRRMRLLEQDSIYPVRSVNFKGDSVALLSERKLRQRAAPLAKELNRVTALDKDPFSDPVELQDVIDAARRLQTKPDKNWS